MIRLPDRSPRKPTESSVLRAILVALARVSDVRVSRNNVGVDTLKGVTYGLGIGSPDIVGILTHGGFAYAFGLEVKAPGARTAKDHLARQVAWRTVAEKRGMMCREVRSVAEAIAVVDELRARLTGAGR